MRITDLAAYKRIYARFESGEFQLGKVNKLPIYSYQKELKGNLTPGHYVDAINYRRIKFSDIPEQYRTRDFFIHALSSVSKDVLAYVKEHIGEVFDREFFKEHIATEQYALCFDENCFEYMPLEYIDEEMVSFAIIKAVDRRYVERRGDFSDWFYSVAKRKPEMLTQDFWVLGARLFAKKVNGKNHFLEITPKEYRTEDYYIAMCLENSTPVMEDFPEDAIRPLFKEILLYDNAQNIQSFSEKAMEEQSPRFGKKFWQVAMLMDGYTARNIPLNKERIEFFISNYDKDTPQYRYGFKDSYKRYLKTQKDCEPNESKNTNMEVAVKFTIAGAQCGMGIDETVDVANAISQALTYRNILLPIRYSGKVPKEYCKEYDQEEYLVEIYKKLGIEIVSEYDYYFYEVKLPQNFEVKKDSYKFKVINGEECVLEYRDVGPFYDRDVYVTKINCSL